MVRAICLFKYTWKTILLKESNIKIKIKISFFKE